VLARTAAEVHTLICEFVYVLIYTVNMNLFGGSSCYPVREGVCVAQNFRRCPACTSSADVIVRKCHETLRGIGPLESHGSQRLLWHRETLLLYSH